MRRLANHNRAISVVRAWYFWTLVFFGKGLHYVRVAQRDERDGYPYTAAMEWRKAAEAFVAYTSMAEYCWRRWERIMRLPRQLAGPLLVTRTVPDSSSSHNSHFLPAVPSCQVLPAPLAATEVS